MSVTVKLLNQKHPTYDGNEMDRHGDLYQGGSRFRANIGSYLIKHRFEENAGWVERQQRSTYENHCAPIIDQWLAEVYADPPALSGDISDEDKAFSTNCDRAGTDLAAFWRARLLETFIHRRSWVLVDQPKAPEGVEVGDRAASRALGLHDVYLVPLHASQVLDWDVDASGRISRMIYYTQSSERVSAISPRQVRHQWTWWDDSGWTRWEIVKEQGKKPKDDDIAVEVGKGPVPAGGVPVVRLELPQGLWLMSLLEEPAMGLFRIQAALDWSLYMSAFAVLVLQKAWGDDTNVTLKPGGFIGLEKEDKYGFLEPSGRSFGALSDRVKAKMEALYRLSKQMSLSVSNDSSRQRASGESKSQDRKATEILLATIAGQLREAINAALTIRAGLLKKDAPRVTGMQDYAGVNLVALLEQALAVATLRIPSQTFILRHMERLVDATLPHLEPADKALIHKELEAGIIDQMEADGRYEGRQ